MNNNIQFAIAQMGRKRGHKSSLAMLLETADIPGDGWKLRDKRTWRTGATGNANEAKLRARKIGSITAWRSFEQMPTSRGMWVEVVPFVSKSDAESQVPIAFNNSLKNPKFDGTIFEERTIDYQQIEGLSTALLFEQLTDGPRGPKVVKFVAGNVDHILFMVVCSGDRDSWPWLTLKSVVEIQLSKIWAVLEIPRS